MSATATKKHRVLGAPLKGIHYNLADNYQPKPPKLFGNWAADGRGCGGGTKDRGDLVEEQPENVTALPSRKPSATVTVPTGWSQAFRARRKAFGWTIEQTAFELGVAKPTVSWWELRDPKRIERERFERACRIMGIRL